jgi:hypothetical protein
MEPSGPESDPRQTSAAEEPRLREVELRPAPPPAASPSRPSRPMRIVGLASAVELVVEALDEALESLAPELPAERARHVAARARRTFLERLRASGRPVRGMAKSAFLVELERSKSDLLEARDRLRGELAGLVQRRDLLMEIRGVPAAPGDPAAPGPAPAESELRRSLRNLLALARDPAVDLALLESVGLAQLLELLTRDRARVEAERSAELELKLDVHQRRIDKLAGLLADSERALAELARLKDVDPGLSSIYRSVQGLAAGDAQAAAKQEALDKIFQANLALRRALASLPEPVGGKPLPARPG